jgi:phosphonate transport system ATP-binding protein
MIVVRSAAAGSLELSAVDVDLGGTPVLRGIDLRVGPGEAVAFVGPSGAGKTTLMRLLNGAVTPTAGTVTVEGCDLSRLSGAGLRRQRARIGFVHQDLRLVPNLRVVQNVLSGRLGMLGPLGTLRLLLFPAKADLREAHRLLGRVGIDELMYQRTDRLSGGQAQRVAVARALFQRPGLLAADEPVASVDPARARSVIELLVRLSAEDGLTLCVSLHDPGLVRAFFPRVVGLRDGRIRFDLPAEAVDDATLTDLYRLDARAVDSTDGPRHGD